MINKSILAVAKAICQAEGEYEWKYLKDVTGNPSTADAYYAYLKMAEVAIKALDKFDSKHTQR